MSKDVQTTILDLQQYVKVKRKNMTYFIYVTTNTRSIDIKRAMTQFVDRKVHDMQLTIPRYDNRKFNDPLTLEMMNLVNGETLTLSLRRSPGSDQFEDINDVTGSYNTITGTIYR